MQELDFAYIGKRIRDVRIEKRLTQEYLAKITNVNVSHISNIELNKVKVSLTLLVQICNALEMSVDYILEKEYQEPNGALEVELLRTMKELPPEKREQLIRIARVL